MRGRPFTILATLLSFVSHLSSKFFVCLLGILQDNLEYIAYGFKLDMWTFIGCLAHIFKLEGVNLVNTILYLIVERVNPTRLMIKVVAFHFEETSLFEKAPS